MERLAEISNNLDIEFLKNTYYHVYGIHYEDEMKELLDSIPESDRKNIAVFYDDRLEIENVIKNEKKTYLYSEFYRMEKIREAYIFFLNKNAFFSFGFDKFNSEELKKLEEALEKYNYKFEKEEILGEIENFQWTEQKIRKLMYKKFFNWRLITMIIITIIILLIFLFGDKRDFSFRITLLSIMTAYMIIYFYRYIHYPKKSFKSMNSRFLKAYIIFYESHVQILNRQNLEQIIIKYEELYKIKKLKDASILYIEKHKGYLFEFSEIKLYSDKLIDILKNNKRKK